ncbi:MAG TPA: prephenate dehydrogenase/arogenate dehydrogenase family protein [Candidatus Dormibacteraeota bacterium]|nr:prephenate dehydrogenase/arogenate dehydrogenase family protein [Candidatus Dormibacteraeota bacterium]
MRVALLGLGLIGGSVARSLARSGGWHVAAWSPSGDGPERARRDGAVDVAARSPEAALDGAGLVILAAPPLACLALLEDLAGPKRRALAEDATITDVASTKGRLVARAEELGLRYVGGHPMAGRDSNGYQASTPDLFEGRPWAVVPAASARAEDVARVERLATTVGARPIRMGAQEHDAAVAAISHLPLVTSVALVEAVAAWTDERAGAAGTAARLAASGWRDATRLARGDPAMGAGILVTNRAAVRDVLRAYRAALDEWDRELAAAIGDPEPGEPGLEKRLRARFEAARERLGEMDRAAER